MLQYGYPKSGTMSHFFLEAHYFLHLTKVNLPFLLTIHPTHSTMHCCESKFVKVCDLCLRISPID